jgi:tRNA pseudouridine55 synthase
VVVSEADFSSVTRDQLEAETLKRIGDLMQTPPMVSAIKKDGVPLYKLARKGEVVEREPRLIHVYRFDLLDFAPPDATFRLSCTKGTYVRTLCADIGAALGCGAHLKALRRTVSGKLRVENAATLDEILKWTPDELTRHVMPMDAAQAQEAPA